METLKINPRRASRGTIKRLAGSVKKGKIIILPTDTVYGLVADATSRSAVERIFKIKKRKREKPIPVFVKDLKMAKKIAEVDKIQEKILKLVWPGRFTVILKPRRKLPKGIGKAGKEIGLRMPDHRLVSGLFSKLDFPLTGTSANISGKTPSTKIKEVVSQFKNRRHQPDIIIDGGNLPKNNPSTIIDLTVSPPRILRP